MFVEFKKNKLNCSVKGLYNIKNENIEKELNIYSTNGLTDDYRKNIYPT